MLIGSGENQISEAVNWLAFGAFHQPEMSLEPAIGFL